MDARQVSAGAGAQAAWGWSRVRAMSHLVEPRVPRHVVLPILLGLAAAAAAAVAAAARLGP